MTSEPQYVTDAAGERVAVLLGLEQYRQLVEAAEEVEALRDFDRAKASGDAATHIEDAVREIEGERTAR